MAKSASTPRTLDFFASHPVFTHEEFVAKRTTARRSRHTSNSLLAKYLRAGRLVHVRRGIYAAVPPGIDPNAFCPDPYLVACRLRQDAAVAYHSALEFHGRAYSVWKRYQYATAAKTQPCAFRGLEFIGIRVPLVVRRRKDFGGGVQTRPHAGGEIRVTSLERCLVDVLHAPDEGGGWEEIWRSLEMVEFFDLDAVLGLALALDSALTAARVGFFLDQHRDELMVDESHLARLESHRPKAPRYFDHRRRKGRLVSRWNLIVPEDIQKRSWEEGT